MVKTILNTDYYSTYTINASDTSWVQEENYSISGGSGDGMVQDAGISGSDILIKGFVSTGISEKSGIRLDGSDSTLTIADTGSVRGHFGISIKGSHQTVTNNGLVMGLKEAAINGTASEMHIVNNGLIAGQNGIHVAADGALIENNGRIQAEYGIIAEGDGTVVLLGKKSQITASQAAVFNDSGSGDRFKLVNEGTIATTNKHAFLSYDSDDTIINRGTIKGNVQLGDGNDTFDTLHGKFSGGYIGGNAGDDTYILNTSKVLIDEYSGEGTDTVKANVSFSFSSSQLAGFELDNLVLLSRKNLDATGNQYANEITGNAGNNDIDGRGGIDILTGGKGADTFIFGADYGTDFVQDFGKGADRIDLSGLADIKSFADLMKNHLTVDGDGLRITAGSDMLVLEGVNKSDLNASDFIF